MTMLSRDHHISAVHLVEIMLIVALDSVNQVVIGSLINRNLILVQFLNQGVILMRRYDSLHIHLKKRQRHV